MGDAEASPESAARGRPALADRARQFAGRIESVPGDVVRSFAADDPQRRVRQLQKVGNAILVEMVPIVGWLEVRESQAADLLKRRLFFVCEEAQAKNKRRFR